MINTNMHVYVQSNQLFLSPVLSLLMKTGNTKRGKNATFICAEFISTIVHRSVDGTQLTMRVMTKKWK